MNLLKLDGISKQYSERLLFDQVSLLINAGDRIGLIGVNGSGKSSLLRIAAGLETPDTGSRTLWGGVRVQYVGQEAELDEGLTVLEHVMQGDWPPLQLWRRYEAAASALHADPENQRLQTQLGELNAVMEQEGGWAAEASAKSILTQLGLPDFQASIATLSGGQRKRLALAYALIDRADLLILDEPTNHIDASAIAWLEQYLLTMPSALLLVTHDRYFLDRVTNCIIELERRQLIAYLGNYTRYLEGRAERQERLAASEEKRQNTLRRELEWLRRGAMARGTKQKARKQRVEELMQIRYDRGDEKVAIALASRRLGDKVLDARAISKRYGEQQILDQVNFHLEAGDRIGILGPNGAGKSTLLDILAGKTQADQGQIEWGDTVQLGYYDQRSVDLMVAIHDRLRIIEFIEKEASVITTKEGERVDAALMLEWFLFPRAMQYGRIGSLSGGERRRLYLLRTLIHQPNVLFLDEPTNDLDIQTLNVLEEFLDHFTGSLVVVSHDRYFLDRTVDFLVGLEDGKLSGRYPAPYSTYERLRAEAEATKSAPAPNKLFPSPSPLTLKPETLKPETLPSPRKLSWKEQRELEQLEARIPQLETDKVRLADAINNSRDYAALQQLSAELEQLTNQLNQAEERWLELSA